MCVCKNVINTNCLSNGEPFLLNKKNSQDAILSM